MFQAKMFSFILLLFVCHSLGTDIHVDPNLNHGGIGFVKLDAFTLAQHRWRLALDYDLAHHHQIVTSLRTNLKDIWDQLMDVRIQSFNPDILDFNSNIKNFLQFELQLLNRSIDSMDYQLANIQQSIRPGHPSHRQKRAVINLGPALSFLFGVASDDDLVSLNEKVEAQGHVQDKLIHIIDHQCTVITNASYTVSHTAEQLAHLTNATHHMAEILDNLGQEFNSDLSELSRKLAESMKLSSSVRLIEAVLSAARDRLTLLEQAWSQIADGKLSQFFLPPSIFLSALKDIAVRLPPGFQFLTSPEPEHLYSFYEFSTVVAAMLDDNRIRFYLSIPIVNAARKFNLFRCHSLPIQTSSNPPLYSYLQAEVSHLAVSQDLKSFITMDTSDLLNCQGTIHKICDTQLQLRSHPEYTCSIAAFLGLSDLTSKLCSVFYSSSLNPLFVNSPGTNLWLFFVPNPSRLSITCSDSSNDIKTSQKVIHGSGVLQLEPHCEAQMGGHTLTSHMLGSSSFNRSYLSDIILPRLPLIDSASITAIPQDLQSLHSLINSTFAPLSNAVKNLIKSPSGLHVTTLDQLELLSLLNKNQEQINKKYWPSAIAVLSLISSFAFLVFLILRFYLAYKPSAAVPRARSDESAVRFLPDTQ